MSTYKGKVSAIKLNVDVEKKAGGTFEAHKFKIDQADGKGKIFTVSVKTAPAKYIEKLKKGQDVEVTTSGKFDSVVKVFVNNGNKGSYSGSYNKGSYQKKEYSPEGVISGMVLKAALDLTLASNTTEELKSSKPVQLVKLITASAAVILSSRSKVDALVKQALKSKDSDSEESDDTEEDDEEESAPKKKAKKSEDEDLEESDDVDDDSSEDDEAF